MTPNPERLRLARLAARYLEALEADDFVTQAKLWKLAESEPAVTAAFRQVHADLAEEQAKAESAAAGGAIAAMVGQHLPSAEIVTAAVGPVTVADVATELFRHPPGQLSAAAHSLNEKLRLSQDPLPADLGLSKLVAWAEARFGTAPAEYWRAFRQAAIKLELRRASAEEYQLAARTAPKRPEGGA